MLFRAFPEIQLSQAGPPPLAGPRPGRHRGLRSTQLHRPQHFSGPAPPRKSPSARKPSHTNTEEKSAPASPAPPLTAFYPASLTRGSARGLCGCLHGHLQDLSTSGRKETGTGRAGVPRAGPIKSRAACPPFGLHSQVARIPGRPQSCVIMAHLSAAPQPGLQLPHASPNHGVLTRAALPPAEPLLPRVNNQVGARDFLLGRETTQLPAPHARLPAPAPPARCVSAGGWGHPPPRGHGVLGRARPPPSLAVCTPAPCGRPGSFTLRSEPQPLFLAGTCPSQLHPLLETLSRAPAARRCSPSLVL